MDWVSLIILRPAHKMHWATIGFQIPIFIIQDFISWIWEPSSQSQLNPSFFLAQTLASSLTLRSSACSSSDQLSGGAAVYVHLMESPSSDPKFPPEEERANNLDDSNGEESESEDDEYEEEDSESEEDLDPAAERERLKSLFMRLSTDPVHIRVHDVVIKGNAKTKDSLIEAEVLDYFRKARTMQELVQAAGIANARLKDLGIFDSVSITLDAGPSELPGTTNVVIEVVEASNPLTGNIGIYSKPEARSWSLEGSLKLKNLFGRADIWDTSGSFGWDQSLELSTGVSVPRFKSIKTPLSFRLSLLSQDWLRFSSYKERLTGLSFGLWSTAHHDLVYNLTWRTLSDPTRSASSSVRRQLGHDILSGLKYSYKVDKRNSNLRPTSGYAFLSSSQLCGLWDPRSLKFFRQEFDFRAALPLGFYNSALNVGISAGLITPISHEITKTPSPIPDRFFLGGHSSLVCSLTGPSSLYGFRSRGVGPTDRRRDSDERDFVGGDVAVTAFADLAFDLPIRVLREAGIHAHVFACGGNLGTVGEGEGFEVERFIKGFRSSVGVGVVLPTKLFRVEVNYCYVLRQFEHDRGKTGIQFSFSSPF